MDLPYVSTALAAFIIVLQQILMLSVGFHRVRTRIAVGLGEDQDLERKVRRHGNLAENGALLVVGLALAEMSGVPTRVVIGFAIVFAAARLSHALGFSHLDGSHNPNGNKAFLGLRVVGATASAWGGLALGAYLAYFLWTH